MQSDKKRAADERRRTAMQPTPTPDEAKTQYEERLETMNAPETPTPTQAEADALKAAAEQPGGEAREGETPEAREARQQREARETPEERAAREAREKQQRDMQAANPAARYTTR
jgi:hypothetical protein